MRSLLIISHDKVGPSMAGPGIRYHQIATELSKTFDVTLAAFTPEYTKDLEKTKYKVLDINVNLYKDAFSNFQYIFALWLSQEMIDYAKSKGIRLIFDLYAPVPVEDLVGRYHAKKVDKVSDYDYSHSLTNYSYFFQKADYFVCSNTIQKDFWTGYAFASRADMPSTHADFSIYDRIGLLPMGINLDELQNNDYSEDLLRKEFPQIKPNDFVLVWTGGIWDWFDATSPIKAMKQLVDLGEKNIKLVFLGTRHPNKDVPEMKETADAYINAKSLGLLNKFVFFREGWIPYDKRLGFLMHANVAIYAHKPSVEARYSHRTRVLDHYLCDLPTIATEGDYLGDYSASQNLGVATKALDSQSIAEKILKLKNNKKLYLEFQKNIRIKKKLFSWEHMCSDIVTFLESDTPPRTYYSTPIIVKNSGINTMIRKILPNKIKKVLKKII
jgi:glycosyltransferase involved in cell wall biosynthesis